MEKHALLIANSASMIDHFNKDNIRILQGIHDFGCREFSRGKFKHRGTYPCICKRACRTGYRDHRSADSPKGNRAWKGIQIHPDSEAIYAEPPLPDRAYTDTVWRRGWPPCREKIPQRRWYESHLFCSRISLFPRCRSQELYPIL